MTKKIKYLFFSDGRKIEVQSEDGRYWYCGYTQISKSNPIVVGFAETTEKANKKKASCEK